MAAVQGSSDEKKPESEIGCLPGLIAMIPFLLLLLMFAIGLIGFLSVLVSSGEAVGNVAKAVFGWLGDPVPSASICASIVVTILFFIELKIEETATASQSAPDRVMKSAIHNAMMTATYIACGFWLAAFTQSILEHSFQGADATTMAGWEVTRAEALISLNEHFDTRAKLEVGAVALILSIAVGAVWPLGIVHRLSKTLTATVAIATASASFTFVDIDVAGTHYAGLANNLRGQMIGTLEDLVKSRRKAAAYHWLVKLADMPTAQAPAPLWRDYLDPAVRRCETIDASFYAGSVHGSALDQAPDHLCQGNDALEYLAKLQLQGQASGKPRAPVEAWVPDFGTALRPSPQVEDEDDLGERPEDDTVELRLKDLTLTQLRSLYPAALKSLNDADAANEELKGEATGAVSKLLTGLVPEQWEAITEIWADALAEQLVTIGASDLSKRLAQTRTKKGKVVTELLAANAPGVKLVAPDGKTAEDATSLGMARLVDYLKTKNEPGDVLALSHDELYQLGSKRAIEEEDERRDAAAHAPAYVPYEAPREHPVEL